MKRSWHIKLTGNLLAALLKVVFVPIYWPPATYYFWKVLQTHALRDWVLPGVFCGQGFLWKRLTLQGIVSLSLVLLLCALPVVIALAINKVTSHARSPFKRLYGWETLGQIISGEQDLLNQY